MSNKRKAIVIALLVICAIALGVVIYKVTSSIMASRANDVLRTIAYSTTAETTTQATTTVDESEDATEETESTNPSVEVVYDSPINFVALQSINPDIYSWIEISDTPISYAVLRNPDDYLYYLNHTFDNQYNTDGSIFEQDINRSDYTDPVTILYGHNLRNREMFGSLREYRNEEYMMNHRTVTIYTPTEQLDFTIFAAVTYSNVLIPSQYDITTTEGAAEFMDSIYALRGLGNIILDDVTVDENSRLLVLSTCNGNSSQRYLVIAVLNSEAEA